MLHRLRRAMVRPGREQRSGVVELDDPLFGGVRPGKRGRGAAGKTLIAVAVEPREPKGFGRCRLRVIPNAEAESLDPFLRDSITPGSTVVTDGLKSYPLAVGSDDVHCPVDATTTRIGGGLPATDDGA
jgi:transposase-like protein